MAKEFVFPEDRANSVKRFSVTQLAKGVSLTFQNGGYSYTIFEPLSGKTSIDVRRDSRVLSTLRCIEASDTLTETKSLNLFRKLGILR